MLQCIIHEQEGARKKNNFTLSHPGGRYRFCELIAKRITWLSVFTAINLRGKFATVYKIGQVFFQHRKKSD